MAGTRSRKKKKFSFVGFINLDFTDVEKAEVNDWIEVAKPDVADCLTTITEGEFKVGISYSVASATYQISMTCKDASSIYHGYCMTFKHSDLAKGVFILAHEYAEKIITELIPLPDDNSEYDW